MDILIIATFIIVIIIVVFAFLYVYKRVKNKRFTEELAILEKEKNMIISASILSELNKVETLLNNDKLKRLYNSWVDTFKEIKDKDISLITDKLIELEELLINKEYKLLDEKMGIVENDIFYIKMKANYLLSDIKEITLSEERNREVVTKLKTKYREVINRYYNNKDEYKNEIVNIELQFENIDKLFTAFELAMENNQYTEIGKIVKAMDDTIGNIEIVIDEAPSIIMMSDDLIPRKMKDLQSIYKKMSKDGYVLDYLNLEYNINEAQKKIQDIKAKLNVLNVDDSIFNLKTILDYFDSIYNDFDKEKNARKNFEELSRTIILKCTKLLKITKELYSKIDDIKYSYDLTNDDIKGIDDIKYDLVELRKDYDLVISANRSKSFAYSKMAKELELINVRLYKIEDKLEKSIRSIGSLKEDELRAREQLDEIKSILKQSKKIIKSYKLPVIPKNYYVEMSEANNAIKEIIKELDKKPLSIKVLNTRVDTARDLVLKLYNTTNETIKSCFMAENAIIYGNRYRGINRDLDFGLAKAEGLFYKGNFKNSLENAINAINIVEPGVNKRILESVKK